MKKEGYYTAYVPNEKKYKFLCIYDKDKLFPRIIACLSKSDNKFLDCRVANKHVYKIRKATDMEIAEAIAGKI